MPATTWQDIHDEFLRRVRTREWAPGARIPGELELAEEFGCARATVGRALTRMADDGMLDRRRRAGTRVAESPVRRTTLAIPLIRQEVEDSGAAYRYVLLERQVGPAPAADAVRLGLSPGQPRLHLRALHLADDRPHVYEDRVINPAAVPRIVETDLAAISANEWLVKNAWYSDGTLAFLAETADGPAAEALGIAQGAAVFVLERRTRAGKEPVTAVRLVYPPGYRMITGL